MILSVLKAALVGLAAFVLSLAARAEVAGGQASAPVAFYVFCQRNPAECQPANVGVEIRLVGARLEELRRVNLSVNAAIRPRTDFEIHGVADVWSIPAEGEAGDCEDYVLSKRHELIARGWPSSALLVTVVRAPGGEGHAVLTVDTADGELILDNRTNAIRPPSDTPYHFFSRQSSENPRAWVSLGSGSPRDVIAANPTPVSQQVSAARNLRAWLGARGLR